MVRPMEYNNIRAMMGRAFFSSDPSEALLGRPGVTKAVLVSSGYIFYFALGPLSPRARSIKRAVLVLGVLVGQPPDSPGPPDITFCDTTPFLTLKTSSELPRNHYNPPSGFGPVLRCYTSQGRTTRDGSAAQPHFTI